MKFKVNDTKPDELLIGFEITNHYKDYERLSKIITVSVNKKWKGITIIKKSVLRKIHKRLYKNSTKTILVPSYILIKKHPEEANIYKFEMGLESGSFLLEPGMSFKSHFKMENATAKATK